MPANKPRSDAAEHRALLLDAAMVVFQEFGTKAPLDLVVQRAGLGRATLYRNFPDREALLWTLSESVREDIRVEAARLESAETGLFDLLHFMCESMPKYAGLLEFLSSMDSADERLVASRAGLARMFDPLLKTAIAAGLCAKDVVPMDLVIACMMLSAVYRGETAKSRQKASRRALGFLIRGLRPQGRPSRP